VSLLSAGSRQSQCISSVAPHRVDLGENNEYEDRETDIRTPSSIQRDRDGIIYDHRNKNLQHESYVKRCAEATYERKFKRRTVGDEFHKFSNEIEDVY
jgi:hypothetical protein